MIHLLYAGNTGVFDGVLSSALSAVMRLDAPKPITVHIFTMDITRVDARYTPLTDRHARFIEDAMRAHNPESYVILHDVSDIYETHLKNNANEGCHCSPYTLLRLLCDLVPDMPEKLLYIDADTLFNRDVSLLWQTDVSEYEYAAARDHYGMIFVYPNYINAGVLLFNLNVCRETGLFEKARKLIREKRFMYADQSALIRVTRQKKLVSQRFNDQKFLHRTTVIRHFSRRLFYLPYPHIANVKQWNVEKFRKKFNYKCFDDIINEYLQLKEKFESASSTAE